MPSAAELLPVLQAPVPEPPPPEVAPKSAAELLEPSLAPAPAPAEAAPRSAAELLEPSLTPPPATGWERAGELALGVGAPVVAGLAGTALGGPWVGLPLAGAASAGVEAYRQKRQIARGERSDYNVPVIVAQGGIGALPGAKLPATLGAGMRVGARALEGAVMGAGGGAVTRGLEGEPITAGSLLFDALVGGGIGTVGGGAEHWIGSRPTAGAAGEADALAAGRAAVNQADELGAPPPPEPAPAAPPPEDSWQPHPVGSEVRFRDIGGEERTAPGRIVGHAVDADGRPAVVVETPQGDVWERRMRDVELAQPPPGADAGSVPPSPPPGAAAGGAGSVPPPDAPLPPPDATQPGVAEPGDQTPYGSPVWMSQRGLHEALHGDPMPGQQHRPFDRTVHEIERVDDLWADHDDETRNQIRKLIVFNNQAINTRVRGTQPVERTFGKAEELNWDPVAALKEAPGRAYNAEQLASAGGYVGDAAERFQELNQLARTDPTPENVLAAKIAGQQLLAGVVTFEGAKGEAGRALNILNYQMRAMRSGNPLFIRRALKLGASIEDIASVLENTDALDDVARFRALRNMQKPNWKEYARSYYITNLLSSPKTQERNVIGNISNLVYAMPATAAGAAVERARGGPRTIYASEIPEQVAAITSAIPAAWRKFAHVMKHGYTPEMVTELELAPMELFHRSGPGVRRVANVIGRGMSGMDEFFRTLGMEMELRGGAHARAKTQALRELQDGTIGRHQYVDRLRDLTLDVIADPPPELVAQVDKFAKRRVFREGGPAIDAAQMLRDNVWGGEFLVPFLRTPMAIAHQGVQATPLGFATKLGKESSRLGAQARGEAAAGTAALLPLAWMAFSGNLSGSGPSDPLKRDELRAQGWQPNSIKIGDRWVGYNLIQPLAIPASIVANGWEAYKQAKESGDPEASALSLSTLSHAVLGAGKTLLQQSYLKSVSDTLNAVMDPERHGGQWLAQFATGFVPGAGALRTARQAADPTIRQPEGVVEAIQNIIPGASDELPARLTATGEPVQMKGGPIARAFMPMETGTVTADPVREELARMNARARATPVLDARQTVVPPTEVQLTFPTGEKIGNVELTREQDFAVRQAKGREATRSLEQLFAQPNWAQLKPTAQQKLAQRRIDEARNRVTIRAKVRLRRGEPFSSDDLVQVRP